MKKLLFLGAVIMLGMPFASCKRCASCSVGNTAEYCRGGVIQNAAFDAAKDQCNANGGKWS
jgi:D-arabinose 1-dehydrogenase-like Zn-dependent alcohol dehydrogenase